MVVNRPGWCIIWHLWGGFSTNNYVFDSMEDRDVEIDDITRAYLSTDIENNVTIVLWGYLAWLLIVIGPNIYRKYVGVDAKYRPII